MTKFCVVWRTWITTAIFSHFYLEVNTFVAYSAGASFNTDKQSEELQINAKYQSKIETHFYKASSSSSSYKRKVTIYASRATAKRKRIDRIITSYILLTNFIFFSGSIQCVQGCQNYHGLNMYRERSAHETETLAFHHRVSIPAFQKPRIELVISRSCLQTAKSTKI